LAGLLRRLGEDVGNGDDFALDTGDLKRIGEVAARAAAASAHANNDGLERRIGLGAEHGWGGDDSRGGRQGGAAQELATGEELLIWICLHSAFQVLFLLFGALETLCIN